MSEFLTIEKLSNTITSILPNAGAQYIFVKAYNEAVKANKNEVLAYASAWASVNKIGYQKQVTGVYEKSINTVEILETLNKKSLGVYSYVKPTDNTAKLLTQYIVANNIPNGVASDKLHSTILYSKEPFAGYQPRTEITVVKPSNADEYGFKYPDYSLELMGDDDKALALRFYSCELMDQFWDGIALGASWEYNDAWGYPQKDCHITLSYDIGNDFDISKLTVPNFELVFNPEAVEPLEQNWAEENSLKSFDIQAKFLKANEDKRLVYIWASVVEKDGEIVTDLQGDQITEDDILKAAHDFMAESRIGKTFHRGDQKADIVESMVFTKDLQNALDIIIKDPEDGKQISGWLVCFKVSDDETWDLVKTGELTCASIGGMALKTPVS